MGNRAFVSLWLLAALLLVGLQHAVITAVPLRGPAGKTLKLNPGKVLKRVVTEFIPAQVAAELASSKKDEDQDGTQYAEKDGTEDDDNEGIASTATSPIAGIGGTLVGITLITVAELVRYPLDTIKTRLQADKSGKLFKGVYDGMGPTLAFTAFRIIYAETPVLEHYLSLPVLENYLSLPHAVRPPLVILLAVVRWLAGFLVWVPFEVVTQRLQAGVDKTWLGAVSSIVASRGLTGFYVGWVPALALRLPFTVILECILVVVFKKLWPRRKDDKEKGRSEMSKSESDSSKVVCALLAHILAVGLMTPVDVVKTRLMTQSGAGQYKGWLDCLHIVTKDEGRAALFRGSVLRIFDIVMLLTGVVVAIASILTIAIAAVVPGVLACGYILSLVIQVMVQQETQRAAARE